MQLKWRLSYLILFGLGLALVLGEAFLPDSPARGWAVLADATLLACLFLVRISPFYTGGRSVALGFYILSMAVSLGIPDIWLGSPHWFRGVTTAAVASAVVWMVVVGIVEQRRGRAST